MSAIYGLVPEARLGGGPLLASLLIIAAFVLGFRVACGRGPRLRHAGERVLILGTSRLAWKVIEEIQGRPELRCIVVGVVDDATPPRGSIVGHPLLGALEDLGRVIDEVRPDRIVVALAERRGRLPIDRLLEARARGILVEDGLGTYERLTGKLALESLTPSSVVFSGSFETACLQAVVARGLGLLVSVVALTVLLPVFGAIALLIKLESRGPVFFIQERVGRAGRSFKLIKFRTMHPAVRRTSEWVRDNSHRITRVGKWLRRFRLDELPQLVNVLLGDMNLVGPRPHPVTNLELLILALRNLGEPTGAAIPYYSLRCAVRPGITGWAQVRYGYANSLEEEIEKIRYDLYYLQHASLSLDLRILFETVKVVLSGRGSADADAGRSGRRARGLEARLGRAA
ncbi:MAG: sugar transferase [Candidatus Rokubacteria bacterium]|nr:sugar transferase [Candidatus Rokubacteria bacterium]